MEPTLNDIHPVDGFPWVNYRGMLSTGGKIIQTHLHEHAEKLPFVPKSEVTPYGGSEVSGAQDWIKEWIRAKNWLSLIPRVASASHAKSKVTLNPEI